MDLLAKLENFLNQLLFKLWEGFLAFLWKLVPAPLKSRLNMLLLKKNDILPWLKALPALVKNKAMSSFSRARHELTGMDYKATLLATYKAAMDKYQASQPGKKLGGLRMLIMTPVLMMAQWLQGLTPAQSLLLLVFTGSSILATVGIISSGHRMVYTISEEGRAPASAEVDEYDRPVYYKKQTRHLEYTALRLPVYLPEVNGLKSVDVDFTVTFNTREAQKKMEKLEFQLRDHLILNVEPSIASFPLQDEGKQILKDKMHLEINAFMQDRQVPGEVEEVKITYILAN